MRIFPRVNSHNVGELIIRWNGLKTEMTKDVFSNKLDFEGYRVYQSLSPRVNDFVFVSSYDKEDYNRFVWKNSQNRWVLPTPPFTIDSLKYMYGENFQPLAHGIDNPFIVNVPGGNDTLYYFSRQDWNASNLLDTMKIHKPFPNEPFPLTLNPDSAAQKYPNELTPDGQFKYFEYQYTMRNLLPSQPYYISVTAFDYGSPGHNLGALETKPTNNMVAEYPQNPTGIVEKSQLRVMVYPNPYRNDQNYRSIEGGGFENRNQIDMGLDRSHRIHFTNLPHKCKIKIFTLDGDLVRELDHDEVKDSPGSMHHEWNMITRNTQLVVSGIYYYTVESEYGNQIGKLVIIM
ncbi:MAG: hypothetical protein NTV06_08960 [candidate division Zixibacteria bacterium]|nr:hypothetical protein [candidate division Zixibacteria bacterium]